MNFSIVILLFSLLITSCVKEEGQITSSDTVGETTGGTTGSTEIPGADDPLAPQAWHLDNTAQTSFSTGVGIAGEDISVEDAIDAGFTGAGVRIALSDTGTDIDHEDLTDKQLTGEHRNYFVNDPALWRSTLPYYVANDAHGTAVAGLIAAEGWNGIGSRGVAPDAEFAAFRFVGTYSSGVTAASYLARAIDQTDGDFDIFNYSYGNDQCDYTEAEETYIEALQAGVTDLRDGYGAVYVQSAGNSFTEYINVTTDCAGNTNADANLATPEIIVVGAVNAEGTKSSYSTPGSSIWVSAPGGEYGTDSPAMVTTDISGCSNGYSTLSYELNAFNGGRDALNAQCSYTSIMNGTSSAAPVLSGVIALMLEAEPTLSWRDVKHILAVTADPIDYSLITQIDHPLGVTFENAFLVYDYKWIVNAAGLDFSNWYGFGRVNALSAVLMANTYTFPLGTYETSANPRTGTSYYDSGVLALAIPESDPVGAVNSLDVNHNFFVESVQITASITHAVPSDLAITLISPSGTESRLLNFNSLVTATSFPTDKVMLTNAFYGEDSGGTWTIRVEDGEDTAGDTGTLTNWTIKINGHKVTGDGDLPGAASGLVALGSYPSATATPQVPFTHSIDFPLEGGDDDVFRYEMSVGTAPGLTDIGAWTSIGVDNTTAQLTDLTLTDNTVYYVNIRAIDDQENISSVVSTDWTADY